MTRRALLAGATGLVGGRLLARLLDDPTYARVHVLARRDPGRTHAKLDTRLVDFERLAADDVPPADDVFVALGTTRGKAGSPEAFRRVDFDYVVAVARAARANGARQLLLVSSVGANPRSRLLYARTKGEVEAAVRALGFPTLHVFRPSFLLGDREETRPAEIAGAAFARIFAPALSPDYRPTDAATLARAMVRAATRDMPGDHTWGSGDLEAMAEADAVTPAA